MHPGGRTTCKDNIGGFVFQEILLSKELYQQIRILRVQWVVCKWMGRLGIINGKYVYVEWAIAVGASRGWMYE